MELVDLLRSQGHAAVVSGAGPSVLVLTTTEAAGDVQAGHLADRWARLTPGVPSHGATVHAR